MFSKICLLQVSLALSGPVALIASWVTNRHSYPDKVITFVAISSSLLMVLFCSLEDSYADYKVSVIDGLFAFIMSASLAFFTVYAKRHIPKVCMTVQGAFLKESTRLDF